MPNDEKYTHTVRPTIQAQKPILNFIKILSQGSPHMYSKINMPRLP